VRYARLPLVDSVAWYVCVSVSVSVSVCVCEIECVRERALRSASPC